MTDRDKLLALLGEWDVPWQQDDPLPDNDAVVLITVGGWGLKRDSDKITGYGGFYTTFEFDADGMFVRMGAWE